MGKLKSWKIVKTKNDVKAMLIKYYDQMGHFGIKQTLKTLQKYLYWKIMKREGYQTICEQL